jgi:hypothetical protein
LEVIDSELIGPLNLMIPLLNPFARVSVLDATEVPANPERIVNGWSNSTSVSTLEKDPRQKTAYNSRFDTG